MGVNSATILELGRPIGSIVFSLSMLTFVMLWVSRELLRVWRRGWLESGRLADRHMSKWDPLVASTVGRIANDWDRGRFAYDLGTSYRHARGQSLTAMICGMAAGTGAGAMLGAAYLSKTAALFPTYALVILAGTIAGQVLGLGGNELMHRTMIRTDALNGAALALAHLLALQQSSSQYWRRRGRITRINRLKKAYALADVPTRDLTSPGLPEIDSTTGWEDLKERAVTLLARAYLGDFLDLEEDEKTSPSAAERVGKVALIGAALAAMPALWAALQQLGAAIIWLRENHP